MKKVILLLALVSGSLITASAQEVKVTPAYWVVETNVNQKNFSIVRMYDHQHILIHEVRMEGIYLNVTRARHRKKLDQLLKGYYPVVVAKRGDQDARELVVKFADSGSVNRSYKIMQN